MTTLTLIANSDALDAAMAACKVADDGIFNPMRKFPQYLCEVAVSWASAYPQFIHIVLAALIIAFALGAWMHLSENHRSRAHAALLPILAASVLWGVLTFYGPTFEELRTQYLPVLASTLHDLGSDEGVGRLLMVCLLGALMFFALVPIAIWRMLALLGREPDHATRVRNQTAEERVRHLVETTSNGEPVPTTLTTTTTDAATLPDVPKWGGRA